MRRSLLVVAFILAIILTGACSGSASTPTPEPTATPTPPETIYSWNLTSVKDILNSRISDLSWVETVGLEGDVFESGDFDYGYFALLDSANLIVYLLTSTPKPTQIDVLTSLFIAAGYDESEAKHLSEAQVEGGRTLNTLERSGFRAYGYVVESSATVYNCMAPGKVSATTLSDMHIGNPTFSKLSILMARSSPEWEAAEPC